MTLTFLVNGFVKSTVYNASIASVANILSDVEFHTSDIKDRTISPCYEDGAIYVTLFDSQGVFYQFIFYGAYTQYGSDFIRQIDDVIYYFNSSL